LRTTGDTIDQRCASAPTEPVWMTVSTGLKPVLPGP
jgi:hypothetical protein